MEDQKRRMILSGALDVFFKYGYKRVSMNEIAESAEVSRPGLYLYFKSKEELFNEAIRQHADDLLKEISEGVAIKKSVEEKLLFAFEIWTVKNFDRYLTSPEAREIADSSYLFALEATETSREKFESILVSVLKADAKTNKTKRALSSERISQILSSALRGFKLTAKTSASLRSLIKDLVGVLLQGRI